ncbi:hypothetical protein Fmac_023148 [Flemingia macrophylla]|uniref:Uncharacterized protein n=1 Tax=Flemingia macrophylla TaxID=520843 RepID=A0ABD1LKQ5_9FABA
MSTFFQRPKLYNVHFYNVHFFSNIHFFLCLRPSLTLALFFFLPPPTPCASLLPHPQISPPFFFPPPPPLLSSTSTPSTPTPPPTFSFFSSPPPFATPSPPPFTLATPSSPTLATLSSPTLHPRDSPPPSPPTPFSLLPTLQVSRQQARHGGGAGQRCPHPEGLWPMARQIPKCLEAGESLHREVPPQQLRHPRGLPTNGGEHPRVTVVLHPIVQDQLRRGKAFRLQAGVVFVLVEENEVENRKTCGPTTEYKQNAAADARSAEAIAARAFSNTSED